MWISACLDVVIFHIFMQKWALDVKVTSVCVCGDVPEALMSKKFEPSGKSKMQRAAVDSSDMMTCGWSFVCLHKCLPRVSNIIWETSFFNAHSPLTSTPLTPSHHALRMSCYMCVSKSVCVCVWEGG